MRVSLRSKLIIQDSRINQRHYWHWWFELKWVQINHKHDKLELSEVHLQKLCTERAKAVARGSHLLQNSFSRLQNENAFLKCFDWLIWVIWFKLLLPIFCFEKRIIFGSIWQMEVCVHVMLGRFLLIWKSNLRNIAYKEHLYSPSYF